MLSMTRNISYLSPMHCNFWEKMNKQCSTPLKSWFIIIMLNDSSWKLDKANWSLLGAPSILFTNFLVKSPTKSPILFQNTIFSVVGHQNVMYNSVLINIQTCNRLVTSPKNKMVTRMDGRPYWCITMYVVCCFYLTLQCAKRLK